ncbi:hypothetical protein J2X36_003237 [Methylobacterium sp. BE186]|nr:hypothetical protein [Methylobacterium sp. BE186]
MRAGGREAPPAATGPDARRRATGTDPDVTRSDRPRASSRAPSAPPSRRPTSRASLFRAGIGARLALAAACAGGLWLVILWALR